MTDERVPFSQKRRGPPLRSYPLLPQDRDADQDINAVLDQALAAEQHQHPVNLGFARMKGHRT